MYKLLFSVLISPLGLPISALYEYLILLIVGEAAYLISYHFVGRWIAEGIVPGKRIAQIMHWALRAIVYVLIWVILRIGFYFCHVLGWLGL